MNSYNMGIDIEQELEYICEVCGKRKVMKPKRAFEEGWDYPPFIGQYGVVSPRTCGECSMMDTVWWDLVYNKKEYGDLSVKQKETIRRIQMEPVSMMVKKNDESEVE